MTRSFPLRFLVIHPETNPSMPCRALPRISTPSCAGPTVGANCHGVFTADVRVIKLVVRPLLRGGIEERVGIDTVLSDLHRFRPLFVLEVKTYSCFLLLRGSGLSEGLTGLRITRLSTRNLCLGEI